VLYCAEQKTHLVPKKLIGKELLMPSVEVGEGSAAVLKKIKKKRNRRSWRRSARIEKKKKKEEAWCGSNPVLGGENSPA